MGMFNKREKVKITCTGILKAFIIFSAYLRLYRVRTKLWWHSLEMILFGDLVFFRVVENNTLLS